MVLPSGGGDGDIWDFWRHGRKVLDSLLAAWLCASISICI